MACEALRTRDRDLGGVQAQGRVGETIREEEHSGVRSKADWQELPYLLFIEWQTIQGGERRYTDARSDRRRGDLVRRLQATGGRANSRSSRRWWRSALAVSVEKPSTDCASPWHHIHARWLEGRRCSPCRSRRTRT